MATIDKQPLTSMNITEEQLQNFKQLFPEVFTEGLKVDWDKLRLTLGETIDVGKERYGMNWPGKADCFRTIQQPSIATLVPCPEESLKPDGTPYQAGEGFSSPNQGNQDNPINHGSDNLFIEGDNLEVLKLLQKSYLGKVKMIYIDPPYNTGNDFIYPDNYTENLETYLEYTGQVDSTGKKFGTNTDTDGRFHSKWMNMMYPRLFLAKNLLSQDGLIFISIDDNEKDNIKKICDEIFGEENKVETIIWKNKYGAGALNKGFISVHEYILCYSKTPISFLSAPYSDDDIAKYSKKDEKFHERGGYITQPLERAVGMDFRANLYFPINYNGEEIYPAKQWIWNQERMQNAIKNNEVVFSKMNSGKWSVRFKSYLKDEYGKIKTGKPISILNGPYNQEGTKEIEEILGRDIFNFPKPSGLIKYLLSFILNNKEDKKFIVLDFFAGSAPTADAIYQLNKEDGGNRKFICVQIPEPTEEKSEAYKAGYKSIAEVSKERIRRVAAKIKKEQEAVSAKKQGELNFDNQANKENQTNPGSDIGFRVFKLDHSNFKIWDATLEKEPEAIQQRLFEHIDHISPEAAQESILYELLLKSGFELTTPIEKLTLAEKIVFSIAGGQLLICLEKELTNDAIKAMAEMQPTRVICLDEAFTGTNADALKTNAVQIMKSKGVVNFRTV